MVTGYIKPVSSHLVEISGELFSVWSSYALRNGSLKPSAKGRFVVQAIPGIGTYLLAYNVIGTTPIYGIAAISQTIGLCLGALTFIWFQWLSPQYRMPWAVISGVGVLIVALYLLLMLRAKRLLKQLIA